MRHDGRANDILRTIKVTRGFTKTAAGSVLWEQGNTVLFCTASITSEVPPWFKPEKAGGWITAEYVMLPGSTPVRKPWPKNGHTDSRGTEIQRLVGRSLRAAIDLSKIGPHTIAIDCQVLQADGGTRTAAICGGFVALVDAVRKLPKTIPEGKLWPGYDPAKAIVNQIAAVSVGVIENEVRLDLDYIDDSRAEVDMNIAMTASGSFVEVQGSAENGGAFDRKTTDAMLDLAQKGCVDILRIQTDSLTK